MARVVRFVCGVSLFLITLILLISSITEVSHGHIAYLLELLFVLLGLWGAFKLLHHRHVPESVGHPHRANNVYPMRLMPNGYPADIDILSRREREAWDHSWHRALYIGFTLAALGVTFLSVRWIVEDQSPRVWGTFTAQEHTCRGYHRSCRDIGQWVSDDGKQTLSSVTLEESLPIGTVVHAFTQPHTPWATTTVSTVGKDRSDHIMAVVLCVGFDLSMGLLMWANHRAWKKQRRGAPCPRQPIPEQT